MAAVLGGSPRREKEVLSKGFSSTPNSLLGLVAPGLVAADLWGPAGREERRRGERGSGENIPLRGYIKNFCSKGTK